MAAKKKTSKSQKVAQEILDDLNGAGYYADEGALADYIAARLGATVYTAATIAAGITSDRSGANIMDTVEEVAAYIDKQVAKPDLPEPGETVEMPANWKEPETVEQNICAAIGGADVYGGDIVPEPLEEESAPAETPAQPE